MNFFEHTKINSIEINKAARIIGIAFVTSVILVTIIDDFILSNLVIPGGDSDALADNIETNKDSFITATILYLIVLLLDSVVAIALYVILKPSGKTLAMLTGYLRLLYVGSVAISLLALVTEIVEVSTYETGKLIGYLFFMLHVFVAGYTAYKSKYIPNVLGILLIIASFCYVIAFYVTIVIEIPNTLLVIFMLIMASGELALSIWLFLKANVLEKLIEMQVN